MLTPNATFYLFIYPVVLVLSYIVVRRSWLRAYPVFLAGCVLNAIVLFFFCLERGTSVLHAIVVCLLWSGFFTGASVVMATLFRNNVAQPTPKLMISPAATSPVEAPVLVAQAEASHS